MKLAFTVPPEVHTLDLTGASHVFYEAKEMGASLELIYFSLIEDSSKVKSSSGLHLADLVHYTTIDLSKGDWIFIPGLSMSVFQSTAFKERLTPFSVWLKAQHVNGISIATICTGAFFLAEAQLLNQRACTTHWKYTNMLKQQYPEIDVLKNRLFVECDGIYTSAGVTSGIDMALHITEKQFGTKLAMEVAREVVVYFRRGLNDPQLSMYLQYRNHLEDRIHLAQNWIHEHLSEKFTAETLAELVCVSPRHLTRLFKDTVGITIQQYTDKIRIEKALRLLQEQNKVETVANACGLKSTNQLRQLLKKHLGQQPSDL